MPFGILEDKGLEQVPGTSCMNDQSDVPQEYEQIPRELLKHGTGRYSHVILVPQPSDSPNDPLNWPTWKKDMILILAGFVAAVVGAYVPMLSPGFLVVGRQPVFLISICVMFVCCVWGAYAENYSSFLASRVVAGFGMAPYEVLVQCTIGDLYFDIGWKWTFGICAILFGVLIPLIFFFVPETAYIRDPIERRLSGAGLPVSDNNKPAAKDGKEAPDESRLSPQDSTTPSSGIPGSFGGFLYGVTLTWIVDFSVVNTQIFGLPPYSFSPSQISLISISPLNHGIYEPEFRLVLMFPILILGIVGFFGFGATLHYKTHWIGPVLCFGIANLTMTFETGYLSEEAFVAINPRNLLAFGLTYFANNWVTNEGPLNVFNVLGSSFIAVVVLTIPLWIFGKKIRSAIARNDILTRFMKDD
ncbi:hypothetical protein F5882DRAFT_427408 [Hyaloscypha sp. PMI_1271]|nr:hypothetical protein F5882DRAFT_427408 [Hyaloscypha sp. PMI_1271]